MNGQRTLTVGIVVVLIALVGIGFGFWLLLTTDPSQQLGRLAGPFGFWGPVLIATMVVGLVLGIVLIAKGRRNRSQ